MQMAEDEPFLAAIFARPADALPKLIYADRLDELGRREGAFWRWYASSGLRPARSTAGLFFRPWCWNRRGTRRHPSAARGPKRSFLEESLFYSVVHAGRVSRVTAGLIGGSPDVAPFLGERAAVLTLLDAWLAHNPGADPCPPP